MIRRFYILFFLVFLVACDDGDILTIDLDFEGNLERCENNSESYLIYDTREDPNESLLLVLKRSTENELLFTEATPVGSPVTRSIDGTNTQFIFRSYNRALTSGELCNLIPANDLVVTDSNPASSGTVTITSTIIDDDKDGIPSEDEYGPGGLTNPQDSDDDGIPDYLDQDDDNDNILTSVEISLDDNLDGDDDPLTNPTNTDGDAFPNYLDDDDDGDGFLTRLEDTTETKNPRDFANRIVNELGEEVYRYLSTHPNALEAFGDFGLKFNEYTRTVSTVFLIENAGLNSVSTTFIEFGTYENSFTIDNNPDTN